MKKFNKMLLAVVCAVLVMVGSISVSGLGNAGTSVRKCYPVRTANIRVYSDKELMKGYVWISTKDAAYANGRKYAVYARPNGAWYGTLIKDDIVTIFGKAGCCVK